MSPTAARWRLLEERDLPAVDAIADTIHTLYERAEVFAEKYMLFRAGCYSLEQNGEIVGYGISHPWLLYSIPPLDTFLDSLPARPECLYIHDVAILKAARGHGFAQTLCSAYIETAKLHGLQTMALVSVYGSMPVWEKAGFEVICMSSLDEKLTSYGSSARYMKRQVG